MTWRSSCITGVSETRARCLLRTAAGGACREFYDASAWPASAAEAAAAAAPPVFPAADAAALRQLVLRLHGMLADEAALAQ